MSEKFGSQTPWAEPAWYDASNPNPYYNEHHVAFRKTMRDFVDAHVMDNVDEWESDNDTIPPETYKLAADCGLLAATVGWPEGYEGVPPRPPGYDGFMTLISQVRSPADELQSHCASTEHLDSSTGRARSVRLGRHGVGPCRCAPRLPLPH